MSFDVRTRVDGFEQSVEPTLFFEHILPLAFEQTRELLAAYLEYRPPPPLAIQVENLTWTLRVEGNKIIIDSGYTEGIRQLRLNSGQLTDLVQDQVTPNGWLTQGTLRANAPLKDLLDWWVLLRGALDRVTPFVPGSISFTNENGTPLQLTRSFTLQDSSEDMRHFLREAGFLHIRNVFTKAEMTALSNDMDQFASLYTPMDGRSFWGRTATGEDRLVRMQYFDMVSERAALLVNDERIRAITSLTRDGHEANCEAGLIEALFKPSGMVDLLSDFPWHKDCSLGRHSYECCSLTIGLSITPADKVRGMLRMIGGSHRALIWPVFEQPGLDLPIVDLPTATGDITMHLSCTMHKSQAPMQAERRVLYIGFRLPEHDVNAAAKARLQMRLRTTDLHNS